MSPCPTERLQVLARRRHPCAGTLVPPAGRSRTNWAGHGSKARAQRPPERVARAVGAAHRGHGKRARASAHNVPRDGASGPMSGRLRDAGYVARHLI